jgi:hypothetical protein
MRQLVPALRSIYSRLFECRPATVALAAGLLLITPAWSAEKPAKAARSKRGAVRVVVIKPDLKWQAADIAGGIVGNLIGQWMMNRRRGPSEFDNWDAGEAPNIQTELSPLLANRNRSPSRLFALNQASRTRKC